MLTWNSDVTYNFFRIRLLSTCKIQGQWWSRSLTCKNLVKILLRFWILKLNGFNLILIQTNYKVHSFSYFKYLSYSLQTNKKPNFWTIKIVTVVENFIRVKKLSRLSKFVKHVKVVNIINKLSEYKKCQNCQKYQ